MTIAPRDYQDETINTAVYKKSVRDFVRESTLDKAWEVMEIQYVTLGLVGEAGEIANKVKKQIRDHPKDAFNDEFKRDMIGEIGDVMWYVSQLCNELGLDLESIMELNVEKLQSRKERGTLQGSGDER